MCPIYYSILKEISPIAISPSGNSINANIRDAQSHEYRTQFSTDRFTFARRVGLVEQPLAFVAIGMRLRT